MSTPGVEVRRVLAVPPEEVFAAFADRVLVAQWLRPSPDVTLTVLAFDFRRGGVRHAKFGRADADMRHDQGWRGALDLLEARLRLGQEARDGH
jgi:uncharacterized protein YndB with AHSA1/START domain